jgi:hypothetical protein
LDPHVGSCVGDLARKIESLATGIARLREAISRQLEAVWAIAECEWNTGGTKPRDLTARSPEALALGFASREVPRARFVWMRGRVITPGVFP